MKILFIILSILFLFFNLGCEKSESPKTKIDLPKAYVNSLDSLIFNNTINNDTLIESRSFVDLSPLLVPSFIEEYGKDALPHIEYSKLIFSPTGKFLAIVTESPQQYGLWILLIKGGREFEPRQPRLKSPKTVCFRVFNFKVFLKIPLTVNEYVWTFVWSDYLPRN